MRRRRVRTWAKWACTLAAVLCVGAAMLNGLGIRRVGSCRNDTAMWIVEARNGVAYAAVLDGVDPRDFPRNVGKTWIERLVGWGLGIERGSAASDDVPTWHAGVLYGRGAFGWVVGVDVVHPLLLAAGLAAFLWYKDRPPRGPHACKGCGYDKSGLAADSPCPECGILPAK
jgi:hypothetical protein